MIACVLLPSAEPALGRRLFAVSPLLERTGAVVFLEMGGTHRLHGGAPGLFAAIRRALQPDRPRGMALASNRFTAEVAARYGSAPVSIARGEESLFLSRLPLAALPVPDELARRIAPLGLQTLGDFASLPVAAIESRYGPQGVWLHRLARGHDPSGLLPERADLPVQVLRELPEPIASLEALVPSLEEALQQILSALEERSAGVVQLRLEARLDACLPEGSAPPRWEIVPAAPETRLALLRDLLLLRLAQAPPAAPVVGFQLEVLRAEPLAVHQNTLFGESARDASRRAEALSRLAGVLGGAVVAPVRARPAHRLEERWCRVDGAPPAPSASRPVSAPVLRLLRPPEELIPVLAGGRLLAFRRGREQASVARLSAPRRLEGGWWEQPWARDEYDLLTGDGALWRICRDLRTRRWLLLGEMD